MDREIEPWPHVCIMSPELKMKPFHKTIDVLGPAFGGTLHVLNWVPMIQTWHLLCWQGLEYGFWFPTIFKFLRHTLKWISRIPWTFFLHTVCNKSQESRQWHTHWSEAVPSQKPKTLVYRQCTAHIMLDFHNERRILLNLNTNFMKV